MGRAIRLFEFLARGQQLKAGPPRTIDTYQREGSVFWLSDLPEHPAVGTAHRSDDPSPDEVLVRVDRLPHEAPPDPHEELVPWLDGVIDDPGAPPALRGSVTVDEHITQLLDERPEIASNFGHWLTGWRAWADRELVNRPVRAFYGEQRVFNRLADRGYPVIPQYPAEGYKIDLVVVGAKARLAIECDGDTWHGPDMYERDLSRQRDLERCGWHFFRIRESAFYVDRHSALAGLWTVLSELDIHPSGWSSDSDEDAVPEPTGQQAAGSLDEPSAEQDDQESSYEDDSDGDALSFADIAAVADSSFNGYEAFSGELKPALEATRQQLLEGILRIVAAEGPVLGHRLYTAYVQASGGHRVGRSIAKVLNSAIASAVRQGLLLEENPLDEAGMKPRTYRLAEQPPVRLRTLGPRPFEHMPPSELAALLAHVAAIDGWLDEQTLYRAALHQLGLRRLTAGVQSRLAAVLRLARG